VAFPNPKAADILVAQMGRTAVRGGPAEHAPDHRVAEFALSYLNAFGYLPVALADWPGITAADIANAIRLFQKKFASRRPAACRSRPSRAMEAQRCGCRTSSAPRHRQIRMIKRRVLASLPRWQKTGLKFYVDRAPAGVDQAGFERTVAEAFGRWTAYGRSSTPPRPPGPPRATC
jgi:hypothetical protein